jgi:hypothetical protein
MSEPGNADSLTHLQPGDAQSDFIDPADDLVTGYDRRLRVWQLTVQDV